jgi:hypothetical protein
MSDVRCCLGRNVRTLAKSEGELTRTRRKCVLCERIKKARAAGASAESLFNFAPPTRPDPSVMMAMKAKEGYEPLSTSDAHGAVVLAEEGGKAAVAEAPHCGRPCKMQGRCRWLRLGGCLLLAFVLFGICPALFGRHHHGPWGPHGPHGRGPWGPHGGDGLDEFHMAAMSLAASEVEAAMGPVVRDRRRLFTIVKGGRPWAGRVPPLRIWPIFPPAAHLLPTCHLPPSFHPAPTAARRRPQAPRPTASLPSTGAACARWSSCCWARPSSPPSAAPPTSPSSPPSPPTCCPWAPSTRLPPPTRPPPTAHSSR